MHSPFPPKKSARSIAPIRAELRGENECRAAGLVVRGSVAMCRKLVAAGHQPEPAFACLSRRRSLPDRPFYRRRRAAAHGTPWDRFSMGP
jgi:hypothetical protein